MFKKILPLAILIPACLLAQAVEYSREATPYEKQQISYVVNTLANDSGPGLLFKRGALQKAGNETDKLHPLRWMETGLTDPQLKPQMKKMRSKGMVWNNFSKDMGASLDRQWVAGSFDEGDVAAYAANIGVDPAPLQEAAKKREWKKFMQISVDQS